MQTTDATWLGLKLYEWLTLFGIIVGPIVAVVLTLAVEHRRRERDQQTQTLRLLLNTRHLPSDPGYTVAINMIPVEFNKKPKVISAWKEYIESVRFAPSPENATATYEATRTKQTRLIFEITRSLGYGLSETDIQSSAYAADGFIKRDMLQTDAWAAWRDIANSLRIQTHLMMPPAEVDIQATDEGEKPKDA